MNSAISYGKCLSYLSGVNCVLRSPFPVDLTIDRKGTVIERKRKALNCSVYGILETTPFSILVFIDYNNKLH